MDKNKYKEMMKQYNSEITRLKLEIKTLGLLKKQLKTRKKILNNKIKLQG